jgi:hypothetical protein
VLPTATTFTGYVENMADSESRLVFIRYFYNRLGELQDAANRSRALSVLELHERGVPFVRIGQMLGVTRARAAQLADDGKLWRELEQPVAL